MAIQFTQTDVKSEAFSVDKPKRKTRGRPQEKNDKHRVWVKSLPSIITGQKGAVDPAHISRADQSAGKPGRGKGKKVDDIYIVPLARHLHEEIGLIGEPRFEKKYGLDLVKMAQGFALNSGDDDAAMNIIRWSVKAAQKARKS